jgi:MFS family permease
MPHRPPEPDALHPPADFPADEPPGTTDKVRLPKTVVAAGWVSLWTDIATEMAYPLLPTFIVSTLGASKAALGLIEGVAETTAALVRLPAGVISDRVGRRKPLMLIGYGVAGLVRPLLGPATAPWHALVVRFADRFGKGLRGAPRDALITDVTSTAQRGRAFGFHRAMDHTGAAIGPLLAFAFLYFRPDDYRTLFLLTAIPGAIVIFALWVGIQEPRRDWSAMPKTKEDHQSYSRATPLSPPVLQGPFAWFLMAVLLLTLGRATELMLLLRAELLGVAALYLPLLWCVYHVGKSWLSLLGGRLADQRDPRLVLLIGWGIHVVVYLALAFAISATQAVALFLLYALHFGLSEPAERVLISRWAGSGRRGTAFGWYHLAIGVASLPASAVFGWLWDASPWGAVLPFSAAAAVALVAMAVLLKAFSMGQRPIQS